VAPVISDRRAGLGALSVDALAGPLADHGAVGGPLGEGAPNHGTRPKNVLTPGKAPAWTSSGRIEPVPVSPKKQGGTWYSLESSDWG
jgi:hypothetical protein